LNIGSSSTRRRCFVCISVNPDCAERQIDRLGSADLATDWGARILSARSELYDPLSYHYGSVWPLFSGWASMAAYAHGRPHVGYQALMATAHLTWDGGLGSITELLSGDFNTAFGRSSHHQVWSEAMLVAPFVRGLLGLEVREGGRHVRFAPQLPADWPQPVFTGDAKHLDRWIKPVACRPLAFRTVGQPVDVTFVDESDTVRYFSAGAERIFPRSPGIIGRKVQNCHPPASVHVVSRILEAFRTGERDVAEFWIQSRDRFIHIRYFAVRDKTRTYRGCLEVSQDVTVARSLQGERRLLDWK